MRKAWQVLGVAAVVVAEACSTSDDPGYHLYDPGVHAIRASDYLGSLRCKETPHDPAIGAIVVPLTDSTFTHFDCGKADRKEISRLLHAYLFDLRHPDKAGRGSVVASGTGNGFWYISDIATYEDCSFVGYSDGGYDTTLDTGEKAYVLNSIGTNCTVTERTYSWMPTRSWQTGDPTGFALGQPAGYGGSTPAPPPPTSIDTASVVAVNVTPSWIGGDSDSYVSGITAHIVYNNGSVTAPQSVHWHVLDRSIADTDDVGTVHLISGGVTQLAASIWTGSDSVTGYATIEVGDLNDDDASCTRSHLADCRGKRMTSAQRDTVYAHIDTAFVRDTGACHEVRQWLLTLPDSLMWDGKASSYQNGTVTWSGSPSEMVLTIYSIGWSQTGGHTLTHTLMHEGFHWYAVVHNISTGYAPGHPSYNGGAAWVDQMAAACIKAESP